MKQSVENHQGCKSPKRGRPHDKYEIEVQVVGTILMKNNFTTPEAFGLNPFSEDLFKIPEIFEKNVTALFTHRVTGFETSTLRLTKFHFTKEEKEKSEEIEAKTKKEIIEMIFDLVNVSAVEEEYMENLKDLAKDTRKKQFLVDLYQEVIDDQLQAELEIED